MKLSCKQLFFEKMAKCIKKMMDGYIPGNVCFLVDEENVAEPLDTKANITKKVFLDTTKVFLPFTVPDGRGNMIYWDDTRVEFNDNCWPGEMDSFGFMITTKDNGFVIESALLFLDTSGPCFCHHFEVITKIPESEQLIKKMQFFLKKFTKEVHSEA
ncbi:hypothetical protein ACFL35_05180 [Candidatus Riflebacteria bacterium]